MILDDIKTIVQANDWRFLYGDRATQNLIDGEIDNGTNFLLLPLESSGTVTALGKSETENWNVSFILCRKSDMDDGTAAENGEDYYYEKWVNHIKPLYAKLVDEFIESLVCLEKYQVTNKSTTEIINSMDWNCDGLFVRLTIKEDLI